METNRIIQGDCLESLKCLPDGCVDMCVTSPPYYALRDYGVDGQIGLEETPESYIYRLSDVFEEVRRIMKDDGTLWVNIGDSYWGGGWRNADFNEHSGKIQTAHKGTHCGKAMPNLKGNNGSGYKNKDLIGIPWMLAFELRRRGWYLRQDIIWSKPNPMPESITDRCVKSHEYMFLLSKSRKYYFDYEAIQESASMSSVKRIKYGFNTNHPPAGKFGTECFVRNKRSVWTVNTKPCREAHFAVYPEELIAPCILAGSRDGGVVLDPFMGSGTTAIAAKKLERKYIGCELNADYIRIAERRIRMLGNSLFDLP